MDGWGVSLEISKNGWLGRVLPKKNAKLDGWGTHFSRKLDRMAGARIPPKKKALDWMVGVRIF